MTFSRGRYVLGCLAAVFFLLSLANTAEEGDSCVHNGISGTCTEVTFCPSALLDLKKRLPPKICSFKGSTPVVCCIDEIGPNTPRFSPPQIITSTKSPKSDCEPLSSNIATQKARKSLRKCMEYHEKLIYPCQESLLPTGGKVRGNNCNWKPESLIISGENSYAGEFPHMVLLGYGSHDTLMMWLSGGTLISEKFVLTAGHCTISKIGGPVTKMRVGILTRSEMVSDEKEYNVVRIIKHPNYNSPLTYNDIALLEADRTIHLDRFAVPACLHDGGPVSDDEAIVTGWGTTEEKKNVNADILQKVTLTRFSDEECIQEYRDVRTMPRGYNTTTQMCYGDRYTSKDSCQGDSGGPIQVKHPKLFCMYSVIGVTSSGRWCGKAGKPGIYVRLSHFLPWIESIVWPSI